jgi:hypothetical protein
MNIGDFLGQLSALVRSLNCRSISQEEYARLYEELGGSFILRPEVLQFFQDVHGVKSKYHGYFKNGQCIGAIPVWGPFVAGERYALRAHQLVDRVDFGYPLLYLPIAEGHRCTMLFRARFLVALQRPQIGGVYFSNARAMSILKKIPEDLLSGKSEFRMKERRFAKLGGVVRDIQDLCNESIVEVYDRLFRARWGRPPHAIKAMQSTLDSLRTFLYGKVLFLGEKPVAIQINFRSETKRTICVDYINGGVDKSFHGISPGSLLSYINGRLACEEAATKQKRLIYSYGKADAPYKDQWCHRVPRGYAGFWMP